MASFNKVVLAGRITRDPELRFLPKGTAVAQFGMAINRRWKTDTGEQKEEVTFVDIDCWGKTAETISKFFKKGSSILVEGRLKTESWEDKTTHQKRSKLGVTMESFSFLDGKSEGSEGAPARTTAPAGGAPAEDDSTQVPF